MPDKPPLVRPIDAFAERSAHRRHGATVRTSRGAGPEEFRRRSGRNWGDGKNLHAKEGKIDTVTSISDSRA